MLARMWGKGNTCSLLVGLQAWTTSVEVTVVVPLEVGDRSTSRSSYTALGNVPKGLHPAIEILDHHAHC